MDDKHTQRKTLFVRNLPYSTTNDKLESIFADIGPIRQCFVVTEKGTKTCRGFGYVKFSLLEDAVKAKECIKSFEGRNLFLTFADPGLKQKCRKKPSHGGKQEDKGEEAETEAGQEKDESSTEKNDVDKKEVKSPPVDKRNRIFRTVVVRGFDSSLTTDQVDGLFKSVKAIEHLEYPREDGNDFALVTFRSVKDANSAIRKLHGKNIAGYKLFAVQQSGDTDKTPKQGNKMARLIVRNLSFQCSESQLKKAFETFGEITEVKIPEKPDGKKCGFGFVQFAEVEVAKVAIDKMNSKPIAGRPVAVDWAIPKDLFIAASKQDVKKEPTAVSSPQQKTPSIKSDDVRDGSKCVKTKTKVQKNIVASADEDDDDDDDDGGLSEDDDNELTDDEEDESDSQSEEGSESVSTDDQDNGSTSEDEGFDDDDDDDDDDEDDEVGQEKDLKKPKGTKKTPATRKTDVEEGRTLFLRNVPFSSTTEELKDVFSEYGDVMYCKVVMDPNHKRPKGTAFVQFKTKESADRCLKKAEDSTKDGGISVSGRQLLVTCAVNKNQAEELSNKSKKKKDNKDTRNLYLAREGLIRPGTQSAKGLSQTDLGKRTKVFTQMREKLKNPNIYVSSTRLSIHNLPTSIDDKQLKKIFLQAVADKNSVLKESRIMRDMNRPNLKGVGKSRGFGFVEFTEHQHALKALQTINNNPDIFHDHQRPIVHFSLENKQALAVKERRMQKLKQKQEMKKKTSSTDVKTKSGDVKNIRHKPGKSEEALLLKEQNRIAKQLYKGPKGLPKHFGPKVRHKTRATGETIEGKTKKISTLKTSLKHKLDTSDMSIEPTKKKRKRGKSEVRDNFDKLVNKYKEQFSGAGNKRKWFDT